ncbi:hypothetical protein [Pseudalkalibacillus caeni]|uniref:Uncharacterized protein n=1 Tax=Exobacillus caeni TaxID=2574798 RepID=A0A5R9F837_9BACL|nr:hypothetical protein [Pseudalkalibacillus caeni]TLS36674.1 hypothetical protein FCL54_14230 [Pseudalkalibacillus caeni]
MKKILISPYLLGIVLGLIGYLVYTLFHVTAFHAFSWVTAFLVLLVTIGLYVLGALYWREELIYQRAVIGVLSGLFFHISVSATLMMLQLGSSPDLKSLVFPYIKVLIVSGLMMLLTIAAGVILEKVDFSFTEKAHSRDSNLPTYH